MLLIFYSVYVSIFLSPYTIFILKFYHLGLQSCQVDLVKDGGHVYFIRFLNSVEAYPEQRAMAAFVLAVIVDGHRRGQEVCIEAGLIHVCLKHLHSSMQTEPLFLQWLCLCLGKLWEDFTEAQLIGLQADAPAICAPLLFKPQPEVYLFTNYICFL